MHLGPVGLTPAIGLTNLGVDSNVFNEVFAPKQDLTATVTPSVDGRVRIGRSRVYGESRFDLVYFAKYTGERSLNTRNALTIDVPLRRIRPFASAQLINTRERPGYEIDARSRRHEYRLAAGNDFHLGGKTDVGVEASHTRVDFNADAVFNGTYLDQVLNRTEDALALTFRHPLTPLTTAVLTSSVERTRFTHVSERDTNTLRVMPGLELAPSALISGSASFGLRQSHPLDPRMPAFNGLVGTAKISYVLLGVTRLSLVASRDLDYSYDPVWPYYLSTGRYFTVQQRIAARWDLHLNVGRQGLAYRAMRDAAQQSRRDTVGTFGGGTGYRLGRGTWLVFTLDKVNRDSALQLHSYSRLQSGLAVTHDF